MTKLLRRSVWLFVIIALVAVAAMPVAAAAPEGDHSFNVFFVGSISTVGAEGEPWVIGGQTLATDENTVVVLTGDPAEAGMWADVLAARQADDSLLAKRVTVRPAQPRIRGEILDKPAGDIGVWVVGGVEVNVTADTKISTRGGPTEVGDSVEVVMVEEAGELTATHIVATRALATTEFLGEIQAASDTAVTVSTIDLTLDANTVLYGTPAVGLIAFGTSQLQEDNSLLALGLGVTWYESDQPLPTPTTLTGEIEALPASGMRGTWTVAGTPVIVLVNSRIHQEKGMAVVGATVKVVGGWTDNNEIFATDVTVLESTVEGGTYTRFSGVIEDLPTGGTIGTWVVDGVEVEVNAQTMVLGVAPAEGLTVHLEGVERASDGVVVATTVLVLPNFP